MGADAVPRAGELGDERAGRPAAGAPAGGRMDPSSSGTVPGGTVPGGMVPAGNRLLWRRWRPRIVAAAVLVALVGLLAGAIYTYLSYRTAAGQLIVQRDRELALLTAVRLRDELDKLAGELEPTARSQSVYLGLIGKQRVFLGGQSSGPGGRLSVFDGGVVLMDNTGRVRDTVPERWDIMSADWSNQEFFKKMLVAQPPSAYYSSVLDVGPKNPDGSGSPVIVVSVPVLGPNDEMVGVLAGMFRLGESRSSALYASVVRLRLPGSGDTYIVDNAGRVIYDSGYRLTGQTMDLAAMITPSGDQPRPRADPDGNEVVASTAPVPGTAWTLVTETDWGQAMAPVQRLATGIIALLALGMVIPMVGVALLARGQRYEAIYSDQAQMEARIGKSMRQNLLPRYTPMLGGWELAVHHQGAKTLRGSARATAHDLYDFVLLPDGVLMISLATVADKGLSAVHLMTTARAAFRTAACRAESAGHALSLCNNLLCPDVGPNAAITSLFALLDPTSGRLQIANAGFCAPLRWYVGVGSPRPYIDPGAAGSAGASLYELVEMREGPNFLGQQLDIQFDHDDVELGPGESIIFYSPGALGIRPETGEPFGPERVRHVLGAAEATSAQAIIDALKVDINEFADANSLERLDITFLALSRAAAAGSGVGAAAQKPKRSLRDELAALGETETDL